METFKMKRGDRFCLRDQHANQGRRGRQVKHSRGKVPLRSAVVEALSVLNLQTSLNN